MRILTCLQRHPSLIAWAMASLMGSAAQAADPVWFQLADNEDVWGPSQIGGGEFGGVNAEVADDFNLVGAIDRIRPVGFNGQQGSNPPLQGVFVRFYEFGADNKPGALQQEYFLPVGDPKLTVYTLSHPNEFDITLEPPFEATGKHFVSVQVVCDVVFGSEWYWKSANTDTPSGEAIYLRNPKLGITEWSHDVWSPGFNGGPPFIFDTANSDVAFRLWGDAVVPTPGVVLAFDNGTVSLGQRLVIHGQNFGANPGVVLIGGVPAPVSAWTDIEITAYPTDATPLGTAAVEVVTAGGKSNSLTVEVGPRVDPDGDGRVRWRFQADDLYIESRPIVAADGTVYAAGINGHLYALEPDGGVQWIYRASPPYCDAPLGLGPDGTIYMGVLSSVIAVNPDGTEKWRVQDPDFDAIAVGPTVGPDGNIYALTTDHDNGGFGAFSLTPEGALRWSTPGFFDPDDGNPHGREFVFDAFGHAFTPSPGIGPNFDSFYIFDRDNGDIVFSRDGAFLQPAVSPEGDRIYAAIYDPFSPPSLVGMDPDGDEVFSVLENQSATGIDVGPDGNLYMGRQVGSTFSDAVASFDRDGNQRWVTDLLGMLFRYDPVVSPTNSAVVVPGYTPMEPGRIVGLAPDDGAVRWQVELPFENDGFVWPFYRARFAPDGQTVYLGTTHNNYLADPYSYLYAIDPTGDDSVSPAASPDLNRDGVVDGADLGLLLSAWGGEQAEFDLNADGAVDGADLGLLLAAWG
jgi:outer membrane protein assembly factor BamB